MIEIPTFALLFQNFVPYFITTFLMEGTWKPAQMMSLFSLQRTRNIYQYILPYLLDSDRNAWANNVDPDQMLLIQQILKKNVHKYYLIA